MSLLVSVVLQMCEPGMDFMDYIFEFQFWKAFTCQYANPLGFAVVGLLAYSGVALPISIRTGSITIPAVLLLIVGGVVLPQTAAVATPVAQAVIVFAVPSALLLLYYTYAR